jgi:hypothetical protein
VCDLGTEIFCPNCPASVRVILKDLHGTRSSSCVLEAEAGGDDHDAGHRDACGREPSLPPLVAVGCDVADQLNLSSRRDSA